MLLKAHIFGVGAAGNKACIELVTKYPELDNCVTLVNSTMKDIPIEYRDRAIELDGPFRGCGKERSKANKMMMDNLKSGTLDYNYDPEDSMCIIVTSSEGGTGSGGSIMLAKYLSAVYKIHVHFYIFTGFEDDGRSLKNTVDLFRSMDIPVRTLECCSGDLADLKVKSFDVEAWSPRQKKYFEVGSCSNLGDAQARRLKIRVAGEDKKKYLAHTLNNTVVAPPRMLIAFLENNLQADGSVRIPEVLRPYMGGKEVLIPKK